jgi:hypothetical protein
VRVRRVTLDKAVQLGSKGPWELLVQLGQLVNQEHQDLRERQDHKELKGPQGRQAVLDRLEHKDLQVVRVNVEPQGIRERRVSRVLRGSRAPKEKREHVAMMELQDQQVTQDNKDL